MPAKENSETVNKAKKITEEELCKIEKDISIIEREIDRILLAQRIIARSMRASRGREFN
jgi:hypothetical protein